MTQEDRNDLLTRMAAQLQRIEAALDGHSNNVEQTSRNDGRLIVSVHGVTIDRTRFTVIDETGLSCFLGNTIPFGLMSRLAQSSDVFVHIDVLKTDVWHDEHVTDETVMRTARSLRAKLREAGIVAVSVNTSQKQHIALMKR